MRRAGSSVGCMSDWYSGGRGFDAPLRQHSFMGIGHEIISMAILSLPLFQVGQLSITRERMCTKYWLTAYCLVYDVQQMSFCSFYCTV